MPVRLAQLGAAAVYSSAKSVHESPSWARFFGEQVAFLSHSHKDKTYAKGLQALLREQGWKLYLDWEDSGMPEIPARETGEGVQRRIAEADWLLYLATPNAASSRWCPWEIGFADKALGNARVIVIPTIDESGNHHGQEYLRLYRQIDFTSSGRLAALSPGEVKGILLESL